MIGLNLWRKHGFLVPPNSTWDDSAVDVLMQDIKVMVETHTLDIAKLQADVAAIVGQPDNPCKG